LCVVFYKNQLYSTLQNKIVATFMSREITYEYKVWFICSLRGADLYYTKESSCIGSVIIRFLDINSYFIL